MLPVGPKPSFVAPTVYDPEKNINIPPPAVGDLCSTLRTQARRIRRFSGSAEEGPCIFSPTMQKRHKPNEDVIAKISENHLNLVALSSLDTADFVSPLLKIISYREVFLSHVHMLYKRMRTQKRAEGAKGAMASGGGTATDVHTTRTSKHNFTSPESCVTERLDVVEGVRF